MVKKQNDGMGPTFILMEVGLYQWKEHKHHGYGTIIYPDGMHM